MNSSEDDRIEDLLNKLILRIEDIIENGLSKDELKPIEEEYFQWKITDFEYNENGITKSSGKGKYISKKSWNHLIYPILENIKSTSEYNSTIDIINKQYGKGINLELPFNQLLATLISKYLNDSKSFKTEVKKFTSLFLTELRGEPLHKIAMVKLNGIVILSQPIRFKFGDTDYTLRQTIKQDLEYESPFYLQMGIPKLERPPAILTIEFLGRTNQELQSKVEQAITIMRLYGVGSIRYISYDMYSASFLNLMASSQVSGKKTQSTLEKYVIYEDDIDKIKKFWQIMINKVPHNFYDFGEKKLDHIAISYGRYSDALLLNGIKERRISNAVMGLESLFLKGGEKAELTYRLKIRVAKVLGTLGYDPFNIKKVIGDAYEIRSTFVHGGHLSDKTNSKINDKYGDINDFLKLLLDYLRLSIIIWIFIEKGKDEFLDLIDDSLIDKNKEEDLKIIINPIKDVIF